MPSFTDDLERIVYSQEQLEDIAKKLGARISEDYRDKNLFIIGVLKGSFVFMADLIRHITVPCSVDFIAVSSYGNGSSTSGEVRLLKDVSSSLEGKDVLLVEDILDSGVTLSYLRKLLGARHPADIRICTLLDKPERRRVALEPDYVGARVEDAFIVGYGLDYAEKYRNLPYIAILKPAMYS